MFSVAVIVRAGVLVRYVFICVNVVREELIESGMARR